MGMRSLSGPFTHVLTVAFDAGIAVSRAVSTLSEPSHVPSTVPDDTDRGSRARDRDTSAVVSTVRAATGAVRGAGAACQTSPAPTGMDANARTATARCQSGVRGARLCRAKSAALPVETIQFHGERHRARGRQADQRGQDNESQHDETLPYESRFPGRLCVLMQNPPEHAARRHGGGEQQKQIKHGGACETSADTGPESKWS